MQTIAKYDNVSSLGSVVPIFSIIRIIRSPQQDTEINRHLSCADDNVLFTPQRLGITLCSNIIGSRSSIKVNTITTKSNAQTQGATVNIIGISRNVAIVQPSSNIVPHTSSVVMVG